MKTMLVFLEKYFKKEFLPSRKIYHNNRVVYIDLIKILSAFLVVFYHFTFYNLDFGYNGGNYIPNINRIIMSFAACSVPLFFMVNGSMLFQCKRKIRDILLKIVKISLLFLIWSFVGFPGWFFRTLVILYILFPLFQYIKYKCSWFYILICISVFVMPFIYNAVIVILKFIEINGFFSLSPINLPHTGVFTMYSILYFLLGPLIYNRKKSKFSGALLLICGWAFLLFECYVYTTYNCVIWDGVNASFPTIGALMLASGVFIVFKNIHFKKVFNVIFPATP